MLYCKIRNQLNHIMPLSLEIPLFPPSSVQNTEDSCAEKGKVLQKRKNSSSCLGFLGTFLFRRAYSWNNVFAVINSEHMGFRKRASCIKPLRLLLPATSRIRGRIAVLVGDRDSLDETSTVSGFSWLQMRLGWLIEERRWDNV